MDAEEEISSIESIEEPEYVPTFQANELIKLKHSFGYDCKRLYNMVMMDEDTLIFASGTYLHYFSISRERVTFQETVFGCGIGFLTKNYHPDYQGLLTIGENGPKATVFIYEYPSMNVRIKLEGAAKQQFTCGSYNYTGELFASQAGYPDYMLTIWRWEKAEIILRSRAFQNDVLHVHFSRYNPILLVSCGLSHIKFWRMANTFTGLKLKGDLGRFGKTDFSDIYAVYMLADENVISGCEWGNMLLWEAGLIKFEICRKGRRPCHTKPIIRITLDNGEVTTVGMDGYVRIWFWETVDLADPPDDDRFVEIEPIFEFYVGNCEIRMVQKIKLFDPEDFEYYAQDGNGGIWYCELNTQDVPKESRKLYSCHGGRVIAAQTSPASPYLMTLGEDGRFLVYDYETEKLILEKHYPYVATDLLWLSVTVSKSCMELVASFEDGLIRQLYLDLAHRNNADIYLIRPIKAHTAAVTRMTVNPINDLLITGSADRTIFIYHLTRKTDAYVHLEPMGFIQFEAIPNCFFWKDDDRTLLLGCKSGEVYEYVLPATVTEEQTFLSYNLTDMSAMKSTKFVSVKSMIRRNLHREAVKKRKKKKRKMKLKDIEKLKAANPGLQIDMVTALADSEPDEEEEPLHIPAVPNPVLWLRSTPLDTIWVSMGGYDAGYIYELALGAKEPVRCTIIKDGDDIEVETYLEIQDFLLFAQSNGKIRINLTNAEDFTDLRNYGLMHMHDPINGKTLRILLSHDHEYLFTIGYDGNVFVSKWHGPKTAVDVGRKSIHYMPTNIKSVEDILDPSYPSLEQEKIYAEQNRQQEAAEAHDRKVLKEISVLSKRFDELLQQNEEIHEDIRLGHKHLLLDDRITNQIRDELQAELSDVREDLAYDMEVAQLGKQKLYDYFIKKLDHIPIKISCFSCDKVLYTFRLERLDDNFEAIKADVEKRLQLEALKRSATKQEDTSDKTEEPVDLTLAEEKEGRMPEPAKETFFFGRDPAAILPRFTIQMLRLLRRYRSRQMYQLERTFNWEKLAKRKPDPNKNHPDDDRKIEEAEKSMGDYKLKTANNFIPPPHETLTYKYKEIITLRETLHELLSDFNHSVFEMRTAKMEIYELIEKKRRRLEDIHRCLPEKNRKYLKSLPRLNKNDEWPELNLIEHFTPGCNLNIKDVLYLEKNVDELLPKPPPPKVKEAISENVLHELEKYLALNVEEVESFPSGAELFEVLQKLPEQSEPSYYMEQSDGQPPPWLIEIRFNWLLELLMEQDAIINWVHQRVDYFDLRLQELQESRLQTKIEAEFMQSYLISMNQELYILRDGEQIENQLLSNSEVAMQARNEGQAAINVLKDKVVDLHKQCDRYAEEIAVIQAKFMSTAKGHKFFDFLRRIFKKKWRRPKPPKSDDESSESSSSDESSSEEEGDTKSIDSTDMTTIRLDETQCPPGLDRTMYELAFIFRADRHDLERGLSEATNEIEIKNEEIKEAQKKKANYEEIYRQENEKLLQFRRNRQQKLNKVYVSVILRMHQLQHFRDNEDYRDLTNSVLFDATILMDLRGRVDQLKVEALETKRLHRVNVVHLRRMNTDLKVMRLKIQELEELIRQEMMKKFGMVIDLDELEEEVLRKYIFELETTAEEELSLLEVEMKKKRAEFALTQEELIRETQANCDKVNILSILTEEKTFLDKVLLYQERNLDKWLKAPSLDLDKDIEKLTAMEKEQKEQIKILEREITTLRVKAKPLQINDGEPSETTLQVNREIIAADEQQTCPEMFQADAYQARLVPDDFIMDRCQKVVQKLFAQNFSKLTTKDNIRRYAYKVTRYLGQAAYSFEGNITEDIMSCIIENLQTLVPKKYLVVLSREQLKTMFNEILAVFDYERSDVNTEDVISGIYGNAKEALNTATGVSNKTHFMVVHMFKELIEILPLEEFQSDDTVHFIVDHLEKETYFDGRCINIEDVVDRVCKYAKENLLDAITAVPIRNLAQRIQKEYCKRRPNSSLGMRCSVGSVHSVSVKSKTGGTTKRGT